MKIMLLFCLFHLSERLSAQTVWELDKTKNGIQVFTTKENTSKFKSVKVEAAFKGNLEKLVQILMHVENNKRWVYNTKQAYLLCRYSNNDILYYAETSLPFPLSNRDMAI